MRIIPEGLISDMIARNRRKMEDWFYSAEEIYQDKNSEWSGDWQGRDLLAQISHYLMSGKKTLYYEELLLKMDESLNADGYFGALVDFNHINEQQLAGTSWYLRALCLWYKTGEKRALQYVRRIVERMYLPLLDKIDEYPKKFAIQQDGRYGGNLKEGNGSFKLSTDVGCLNIAIDGLTAAYELLGDKTLRRLIEKMIEHFAATDVNSNQFQTHATLTALRGVLRFYAATGEERYLELAEKFFGFYLEDGMTLNFANYNWFGRPEWTEPCAIVDSFILSKQLYLYTENVKYLKLAYQVFYNALVYAERENGGFGCDTCSCEDNGSFRAIKDAYDAYWCCSMRGAEGLRECVWREGGDKTIDFLVAGTYEFDDGSRVRVQTKFPYEREVIISSLTQRKGDRVVVCIPEEYEIGSVQGCTVQTKGERLEITQTAEHFRLEVIAAPTLKKTEIKAGTLYDYGVLRLCEHGLSAQYETNADGKTLKSVPYMGWVPKETCLATEIKIVL